MASSSVNHGRQRWSCSRTSRKAGAGEGQSFEQLPADPLRRNGRQSAFRYLRCQTEAIGVQLPVRMTAGKAGQAEKAQGILAERVGRGRAQEPALQISQRPGMGMHMPAGIQGQRIDAQVTGGQIRRQAPTTERHEFTAVPQTDLNAFPHAGGIGMRRQKGGIVSVHGIIQLNRCLSQQDVTDGTANKVGLHDDIMP